MATKHIAIYQQIDEDLWEQAKKEASENHNLNDLAEGEILGHICAEYLGKPKTAMVYDGNAQRTV